MEDVFSVLERTVCTLRCGGVVLYPTDTVWGLGCDATNAAAVERLYAIKERDRSKSMLVLAAGEYDAAVRPTTRIMPRAMWQKMLGMDVAEELVAADGTLGVRVPCHEFCQMVVRRLGAPLVSTSANFSGQPTPSRLEEIDERLKAMVDYCVPPLPELLPVGGKPSRIVKLNDDGSETVLRD